MKHIWYIKDNKRTKEIVDHQFQKNLRKGGTDRQKDNIVSFIKFIFINETRTKPRSLKTAY